jgi:hypothetical protein
MPSIDDGLWWCRVQQRVQQDLTGIADIFVVEVQILTYHGKECGWSEGGDECGKKDDPRDVERAHVRPGP